MGTHPVKGIPLGTYSVGGIYPGIYTYNCWTLPVACGMLGIYTCCKVYVKHARCSTFGELDSPVLNLSIITHDFMGQMILEQQQLKHFRTSFSRPMPM